MLDIGHFVLRILVLDIGQVFEDLHFEHLAPNTTHDSMLLFSMVAKN